ncbi:hypothetical protein VFPPC_07830 [Pochonia chlamydosporia 170]|uniref:Uncharacterized protein n=1 Tax=Pochonia chlamydosporia 170 TaxID=1380566 RepID=A0A179FL21_METCM|nr:hypothetical protein VFPPC_07830 [Pochonia chlamydosporia 170]OAQ66254.1 hypothetical protein VFPPC_07830 [Pochonia chlamydosporia 170]
MLRIVLEILKMVVLPTPKFPLLHTPTNVSRSSKSGDSLFSTPTLFSSTLSLYLAFANMCTETNYILRCEHVATGVDMCPENTRGVASLCKNYKLEELRYPFTLGKNPPACPKSPACPFEVRGGYWNCCWCGKIWNTTGRCGCRMVAHDHEYFCEHICCDNCGKGSHLL